jgi:hypothetical protein
LTKAGLLVYHMITMLSLSHDSLSQHAAAPIPRRISGVLGGSIFRVAQVLDKNEAENEPEQSIEKQWLTEAKKDEAEQPIENKRSRLGQIFCQIRS